MHGESLARGLNNRFSGLAVDLDDGVGVVCEIDFRGDGLFAGDEAMMELHDGKGFGGMGGVGKFLDERGGEGVMGFRAGRVGCI